MSKLRMRFRIEAGFASLSGLLAILTIFSHDWIEAITGFDPDERSGSSEWMLVGALAVACAMLALAARADLRRLRSALPAST